MLLLLLNVALLLLSLSDRRSQLIVVPVDAQGPIIEARIEIQERQFVLSRSIVTSARIRVHDSKPQMRAYALHSVRTP